MIKYILIAIFLSLSINCLAQLSLKSYFNSTGSGRSIVLSLNQNFDKSEVGFGLRYNVNKLRSYLKFII
jgi:hypothetical protein